MATITRDDIDALVGPATPHFAYQLRARVRALIADLPEDDPVRRYGEEKMELLDRLGYASSKAEEGPREPPVTKTEASSNLTAVLGTVPGGLSLRRVRGGQADGWTGNFHLARGSGSSAVAELGSSSQPGTSRLTRPPVSAFDEA